MMKKLSFFIIGVVLIVALSGCKGQDKDIDKNKDYLVPTNIDKVEIIKDFTGTPKQTLNSKIIAEQTEIDNIINKLNSIEIGDEIDAIYGGSMTKFELYNNDNMVKELYIYQSNNVILIDGKYFSIKANFDFNKLN